MTTQTIANPCTQLPGMTQHTPTLRMLPPPAAPTTTNRADHDSQPRPLPPLLMAHCSTGCFPCLASTSDDDAKHILLWLDIMEVGPTSFEHKIACNLCSTDIAPTLFAILLTWSDTVKLAHGFANMLLTNGQHWANGRVGFFLGDCIAVPLSTGGQLQDPQLVLAMSFYTLLSSFSGLPTSEQCIKCNTAPAVVPAVPAGTSSTLVTIHKLFPIP